MSVYVGDLTGCEYTEDWPYLQKAVMVADDLDELLDLAARCGINKDKLRTVDGVPQFWLEGGAEDCLRETFLSAYRHLSSFTWQEGGLYPWLKTMAKNKARDLLRASGRRQRLRGAFEEHVEGAGAPEAKNPAEEELQRDALRARIEVVLAELNPRYAAVLRLRLLEDRSREECATTLDVKIGTLDVLLFRACKAFRAACEKRGLPVAADL